MAVLSKLICLGAALLSSSANAAPLQERDSCDFGIADPAGWQSVFTSTWCGMVNNEVAGLKSKEDATTMIPNLEAIFKQANIKIAPSSALPDVNKIMADPMAKAAMKQMKANFPAFGSMDLTPENIQTIYADAIKNACSKTGVPEDIMVKIIWTESKGHPLVYQGLTQMDYVAWGQMADEDSSLKNRYMPEDNILASAMYLKKMNGQYGGDYATTYTQHYQDPTAKDRAQ